MGFVSMQHSDKTLPAWWEGVARRRAHHDLAEGVARIEHRVIPGMRAKESMLRCKCDLAFMFSIPYYIFCRMSQQQTE